MQGREPGTGNGLCRWGDSDRDSGGGARGGRGQAPARVGVRCDPTVHPAQPLAVPARPPPAPLHSGDLPVPPCSRGRTLLPHPPLGFGLFWVILVFISAPSALLEQKESINAASRAGLAPPPQLGTDPLSPLPQGPGPGWGGSREPPPAPWAGTAPLGHSRAPRVQDRGPGVP